MSSAGFQLVAGRIPGERIAGTLRTSSVGTFTTTETIVDTVTAALVSGRTYGVWVFNQTQSSVAGDAVGCKIREDNVSGTILANQRQEMSDSGAGYGVAQYVEYTASATANKTFVATQVRSTGTGNITAAGSANQQANIYVEYVSG